MRGPVFRKKILVYYRAVQYFRYKSPIAIHALVGFYIKQEHILRA